MSALAYSADRAGCVSHPTPTRRCTHVGPIRYTTTNLNNLVYQDGDVPYECLYDILQAVQLHKIYTDGEVALRFLQNVLPTSMITNIQTQGFTIPSTLPDPACFRRHNFRYCAKAKAIAVKNFVEYEL